MPTDIIKETDKTTFSDNLSDELYPKVIDNIKSIWLETNNNDGEKYSAVNSILKSTEYCNSDYLHWPLESFIHEVHSYGFLIGTELEIVKAKSRRSLMQQMSNHISKNFQSLYGKENNGVRQNYFQIGVRVPSKEHVSEIVGKQGLKIKEIRENTGALIITPGESEDHVFIIEATPTVALCVAKFINERSNEITTNRARDNFPKSMVFNVPNRFGYNKPFTTICSSKPILATGIIEVPKNIVGRIIGTHGSIITTIQKDTGTEIRSPPKDNHLPSNNSNNNNNNNTINSTNKSKFEIIVYQKSNSIDIQEAVQRIKNAKQLIAHVAIHQMERIRAEESPFSNYRIKNFTVWETSENGNKNVSERSVMPDKEKLLNYQMQSVAWLWTDIDRLDEQVSEEVVLRILEESKKKSKLRADYGNIDAANGGIERFDDISIQQASPFKQGGNFTNGYEAAPSYSPGIYSDIMHPASPIKSNGSTRDSAESGYGSQISFPSVYNGNNMTGSSGHHVDSTMSANSISRPTSLSYKNPLHSHPDSLTTTVKSYAEHFKAFITNTSTNNGTFATTITTTQERNSCALYSHGAIGDHIKKSNQNKTAQYNKI